MLPTIKPNRLTVARKIELWVIAHGVQTLIAIMMVVVGLAIAYGLMFMQAWCFDQHSTALHAAGWLILVSTSAVIYYLIRPLPER